MDDGTAVGTGEQSNRARSTTAGTFVGLYAFFDGLIAGVPIIVLAAWLNPLIVFAAAAVATTLVNIACCTWLQRQWDQWIAGNGKRLDAKLAKLRASRLMRHAVGWIDRGSDGWFALAAALVNAILAVALARVTLGEPVSARRIRFASVAYGIFFSLVYSGTGLLVGDVIRAA